MFIAWKICHQTVGDISCSLCHHASQEVVVGLSTEHSGRRWMRNKHIWSDEMQDRLFDLVALGPELRDEAKSHGKGVNESYLLVHHVLARAFQEDLKHMPKERLRTHLSQRLQASMRGCPA